MRSLYERTGSGDVQTGLDLERAWLGSSSADFPTPRELTYGVSLVECLLNQPKGWNPLKPKTRFGQSLHYEVSRHLSDRLRGLLGLYVSVGHSLDWFWGVDCFFFLGLPRDEKQAQDWGRFFTIDVCAYAKSVWEVKANILITRENLLGKRHDLRKIGVVIANYFLTGEPLENPTHFNPMSWRTVSRKSKKRLSEV